VAIAFSRGVSKHAFIRTRSAGSCRDPTEQKGRKKARLRADSEADATAISLPNSHLI